MNYNSNYGGVITSSNSSTFSTPNNNNNDSNNQTAKYDFSPSPLPSPSPNHQQRILNAKTSNNSTPTRSKRRNSIYDQSLKKIKQSASFNLNSDPNSNSPSELNLTNVNSADTNLDNTNLDNANLDNTNLDEYPKFHHPDGGYIQFTPVGNIRTFLSDSNVMQRIIEKNSTFDLNKIENGIDGYKLYLGNTSLQLDSSPSNEIEGYMRTGYNNLNLNNSYYNNPGACSCMGCDDFNDCDSDIDDEDDCGHHHDHNHDHNHDYEMN